MSLDLPLIPSIYSCVSFVMELVTEQEQKLQPNKAMLFDAVLAFQQGQEKAKNEEIFLPIIAEIAEERFGKKTDNEKRKMGKDFARACKTLLQDDLLERFNFERFVPFQLTPRGKLDSFTSRWIELWLLANNEQKEEYQCTSSEMEHLREVLYAHVSGQQLAISDIDRFFRSAKAQMIAYASMKRSLERFTIKQLVRFAQPVDMLTSDAQFLLVCFDIYKIAREWLSKNNIQSPKYETASISALTSIISSLKTADENTLKSHKGDSNLNKLYLNLQDFMFHFRMRTDGWKTGNFSIGSVRPRQKMGRALSTGSATQKNTTNQTPSFINGDRPLLPSSSSNPQLPNLFLEKEETSDRPHTHPPYPSASNPQLAQSRSIVGLQGNSEKRELTVRRTSLPKDAASANIHPYRTESVLNQAGSKDLALEAISQIITALEPFVTS